jgi:hypothetical protein
MKKLVEIEKLIEFQEMMKRFSWSKFTVEQEEKLDYLIKYFSTYILEVNKLDKNQLKREIYAIMKNAETPEKSKSWHNYYKNIDKLYGAD